MRTQQVGSKNKTQLHVKKGSDWMRIKMSIPRSESDRPLLFKDEMMKLFHEKIPNFADKDVIFHHFPIFSPVP